MLWPAHISFNCHVLSGLNVRVKNVRRIPQSTILFGWFHVSGGPWSKTQEPCQRSPFQVGSSMVAEHRTVHTHQMNVKWAGVTNDISLQGNWITPISNPNSCRSILKCFCLNCFCMARPVEFLCGGKRWKLQSRLSCDKTGSYWRLVNDGNRSATATLQNRFPNTFWQYTMEVLATAPPTK